LADSIFTETPTEDELVLARTLQAARTAEEIALALVRIHRAQLPAPEDLAEDAGPPPRDDRRRMGRERFERRPDQAPAPENTEYRQPRERRQNNRDFVWFRLNIGRERNADPRWLVPLICQAGGITKAEIGAIKIFDRDTRFEIVAEFADAFADTVR